MAVELKFAFDIDASVKMRFGDKGVVVGLFYDESGNQHSVRTKYGDKWLKEKDLSPDNGS